MWLVKKQYKPFSKVFDNDILETFFPDAFHQTLNSNVKQKVAVELSETDKDIFLKVEIPGYDKKDIQIHYKEGYISINAEKKSEKAEKHNEIHYSEFSSGGVSRNVYVGEVNFDKAKATLENGILAIKVSKVEELQPTRLEIL